MKLTDRERVDGTPVTIGHRVYYRDGCKKVSKGYSAEYRDTTGKQVCEGLGTRSRLEARRMAVEIFTRLREGCPRIVETNLTVEALVEAYFNTAKARGLARKTEWKYATDLDKLKEFCLQKRISLAHRFSRDAFFGYRQWLAEKDYADKTIYGALTLAKQVFKWGFQEGRLREYRLAAARIAKAKARPQPCFRTEQAELIVANSEGAEKVAFAILAYAGLRIGELEQLQWADVQLDSGDLGMFHIRRGGSTGTTKDKDHRFVPISPRIRPLLVSLPRTGQLVFPSISERKLLKRLKEICHEVGLPDPKQYKLHSFRHHFASMCANHGVAHRKALAWLGHSSSDMLDLYYHLHDADSQAAMKSLTDDTFNPANEPDEMKDPAESMEVDPEGTLRATVQSTIDKTPQAPDVQELVGTLCGLTERVGFEPTVPLRAHGISSAARSAAPAPLQF